MDRRVAGAFVVGLLAASFARTQEPVKTDTPASQSGQAKTESAAQSVAKKDTTAPNTSTQNAADTLVLELPSSQWFEGPLERVAVSGNGRWAIINSDGLQSNLQLFSLQTRHEDPLTLTADLNRIDNAIFCGPGGRLARLGERTVEDGWFLPHDEGEQLSPLPGDAVPVCAGDETELAYYRAHAADQEVFVNVRGRMRDFGLSGRITAMAFSPDGDYLYVLLFMPNGESSLVRIEVNTGASKVAASHLDASPLAEHISISQDGRKMFLALASDDAPNNEQRHQPDADRWLKIYELDLTTGAKRTLVDTPGEDNNAPAIAGSDLYWVRTVYQPSIVLVPVTGGDAKEIVAGGELPMWSPDSKRIGYFFGGARQADWGLNLDDAVLGVDEQGNRASQPSVIVSGYGEDFPPAWSPDGKWIAFHSHRWRTIRCPSTETPRVPMTFTCGARTTCTLRKFVSRILAGKLARRIGRQMARNCSSVPGSVMASPASTSSGC